MVLTFPHQALRCKYSATALSLFAEQEVLLGIAFDDVPRACDQASRLAVAIHVRAIVFHPRTCREREVVYLSLSCIVATQRRPSITLMADTRRADPGCGHATVALARVPTVEAPCPWGHRRAIQQILAIVR